LHLIARYTGPAPAILRRIKVARDRGTDTLRRAARL